MNLLLDMKTILISLVVGHVFTVALIIAYWRNHSRDSTFNIFFLAKCIQAVAWLLLTLRGGISDIFTISIANTLLFIGSALESIAILKLVNHFNATIKKVYIGLTIFFIACFHLILVFYNYENIRIVCASLGTTVLVLLPAFRLMRDKKSTLLMKIMGFFYCIVSFSLLLRAIAAFTSDQQMGLFTPGLIQTVSFLALYLVMILGNTGFILVLKERADQELVRMAYYDDLTHTLNRRTFVDQAKEIISKCAKDNKPLSYILFDVDHFKKFNDGYGHDAGDRILQDLSKRIQQLLEPQDLFGRYGGDEFAILLPELNEKESVEKVEQITNYLSKAEIAGVSEKYSISVGVITVVPDKETKIESLYVSCDKALYQAKHNGRNCICCGELDEINTV
ncbi:GGDEF domain-containing protein [Lysinibacillus sp. BW-2-10]|uniref:GGDEF domain-containing protein n=1 Tax=Lysinibacillus sp. BW-2-10 TaxID=2590030 RepID=UPI001643498E|nr:GGDEF domain-containing protein [Lysinibacillus sp. BW-2-10]